MSWSGRNRSQSNRQPGRGQRPKEVRQRPKEVLLERAMQYWGVRRGKNDDHDEFWESMMAYIQDADRGEAEEQFPDYPRQLTGDPMETILEGFLQEFRAMIQTGKGLVQVTDRFQQFVDDGSIPSGPPFFFDHSSRMFRRKPAFEVSGMSTSQLDPFLRYSFKQKPAIQIADGSAAPSVAHRAIVAHHACTSGAYCINCKTPHSIRWNACEDEVKFRYWKKLVCIECGSAYEIKLCNDLEVMKRNFEKGIIQGGNFYNDFCAVQKEMPVHAKQYVCVQSKETVCDVDGQMVWPVHVAEVRDLQPTLKLKSFHREDGRCKVYSRILLKRGKNIHWFNIPFFEYDSQEIAEATLERLSNLDGK